MPDEHPNFSRTVVVVPCYNEAHRFPAKAFREYLSTPDAARLLFVDDGSRDQTRSLLEQLCACSSNSACLLALPGNSGKGEAVRRGMLYAIEHFHPELVGFWDADLATPLDAIPRLAHQILSRPELEMIFGSRVKLLGREVIRDARRHYLGRVFATVVSNVLDLPIYDTQCGAKLFRNQPLLAQVLGQPFLSKWVFDVEILARYRRALGDDPQRLAAIIYEYPLEAWRDVAGSKVRPTDFFTAFIDILRIRSRYLK